MSQLTELFTVASYLNSLKVTTNGLLKDLENKKDFFGKTKPQQKEYNKIKDKLLNELEVLESKHSQVMTALKEDVEEIYNYDSLPIEEVILDYTKLIQKRFDEIKKQENKRDRKLAKV